MRPPLKRTARVSHCHYALPKQPQKTSAIGASYDDSAFAEALLEHFARLPERCDKNVIGSTIISIGLACANKSTACSAASFAALNFERLDLNCSKWAEEEFSQPQHHYLIFVLDY
jgi:hypothetical protein